MLENVRLLTVAAALLAAAGAAAGDIPDGVASYDTGLSRAEASWLGRAQETVARARVGRRLLAEAADLPRRGARTGVPVAYRRNPPALIFDFQAAAQASSFDFDLDYIRELRRAAIGFSKALPQEELAARQDELAFAVELAGADRAFAAALRPAAGGETGWAARELAVFADSPEGFYEETEKSLPPQERARGLDQAFGGDNGLARAKEALDGFDGEKKLTLRRDARRLLGLGL